MKLRRALSTLTISAILLLIFSCSKTHSKPGASPKNPDNAEIVSIDRFSADAGHLQVRNASNGLPAANASVNFDNGPFITIGLTSDGKIASYYNFDIHPSTPAPIYVLYKKNQSQQVQGQLNIVNVIPGDKDYNDFWQVNKVTVPDDYVANTVTSLQEIMNAGWQIEETNQLVNCPIVPKGSTASLRFSGTDNGLTRGWYNGRVVYYFNFSEKALQVTSSGEIPIASIYVSFNVNPGETGGGPTSGFMTEPGSSQTHNVVTVVPTDAAYSPLWKVIVYDNKEFNIVNNFSSLAGATILVPDAGDVNCPIVAIH